jgi:hypothetical protein
MVSAARGSPVARQVIGEGRLYAGELPHYADVLPPYIGVLPTRTPTKGGSTFM